MNILTPHELAEKRLVLAAAYASLSERLGGILSLRAQEWPELRKKTTSDSQANHLWQRSEIGVEEMTIRLRLRSVDKEFGAIKPMLEVLHGEAETSYNAQN